MAEENLDIEQQHEVVTEPVSPGYAGKVWNPILWAELRRWRARPVTYSAFVLVALAGIIANYYASVNQSSILSSLGLLFADPQVFSKSLIEYRNQYGVPGFLEVPYNMLASFNNINYLMERWVSLILRPSTILPLLMVWRALVSFRSSDFYGSLQTTFLRPRDFLWGIVGIPFWISAIILILYTGLVLSPRLVSSYYQIAPDRRLVHPLWQIMGILFEGGLNGGMICTIALFFGLRWKARLSNIMPVLLMVFFVQFIQGIYITKNHAINTFFFENLYQIPPRDLTETQAVLRSTLIYLMMGTPKIFVVILFWYLSAREIRKQAMEHVPYKKRLANLQNPLRKFKIFRQQPNQES